jgi:hypothetical protein
MLKQGRHLFGWQPNTADWQPALPDKHRRMASPASKYWEIIADNLSQSRLEFGLGVGSGFQRANDLDCRPHRDDGKRVVVRADEKLTAFPQLDSAICDCGETS